MRSIFLFLSILLSSIAVNAGELSQDDVDKVVKTAPAVVAWFEREKASLSEEALSMVGNATFEGGLHKAFGDAASQNSESMAVLESAATENGFSSYSEFANAADKAYSLLAVNTLMSTSASLISGEEVKNIFEYLEKEGLPADQKEKLQGYLPDMYERLNADPADLPIVLKNFDSLKGALIR